MDSKKYTEEDLLSSEFINDLFSIDNEIERESAIIKAQARAKELKCKTEFDKMLNAGRKEYKKYQRELQAEKTASDNMTEFSGDYPSLNCGGWIANDNGIYAKDTKGTTIRALNHPLTIVSFLKNVHTGKMKAVLAYKSDANWEQIIVPKSTISDANKILALSDTGIDVNSENKRNLIKYLFELKNNNQIPMYRSSSHLGWHDYNGQKVFVPYDDDIIRFDNLTEFEKLYKALQPKGSYIIWLDTVKDIFINGYIESRIYIAASFASVLIGFFNALPFWVHLHGESGKGKSVTQMIAASVWGDPDENGGYWGDYKTTATAIEARANVIHDMSLILDDSSKVSTGLENNFTEFIYTMSNGTGKQRSNVDLGLRAQHEWKCVILSSGEQPLTRENSNGGEMNRVIEIDVEDKDLYPDDEKIINVFSNNYAHAGKKFVEIIKEYDADAHKRNELNDRRKQCYGELIKSGVPEKQALSWSLIMVADYILCSHKDFFDNEVCCLNPDDIVPFAKPKQIVSENERCHEYVIGTFDMHRADFSPDVRESWGTFIDKGDTLFYIVNSVKLSEVCDKGGYDRRKYVKWAKKHGHITGDRISLTGGGHGIKFKIKMK